MFWFPFIFLVLYYVLQWNYQNDKGFLCPNGIWNKDQCKRPNTTSSENNTSSPNSKSLLGFLPRGHTNDHTKCCREWTKQKYSEWGDRAVTLSSLLTFLLGFYVSRIVACWWNQVCGIPDIDNTVLMLAGLVSSENQKFRLPLRKSDTNQNRKTDSNSSSDFPGTVLEAEKMVARFGLLAWTLCFNTISPVFRKEFNTFEKLKKKGLLNDRELVELKVNIDGINLIV